MGQGINQEKDEYIIYLSIPLECNIYKIDFFCMTLHWL